MVASINSFGLSPGFLKGVNEGKRKKNPLWRKLVQVISLTALQTMQQG